MAVLMSELGRTDPAAQAVTRSLLLRWRSDLATGVRAMQANGTARDDESLALAWLTPWRSR